MIPVVLATLVFHAPAHSALEECNIQYVTTQRTALLEHLSLSLSFFFLSLSLKSSIGLTSAAPIVANMSQEEEEEDAAYPEVPACATACIAQSISTFECIE